MIRAVLDPGVLIAALISSQGAPARLLTLWVEGAFELVVSPKLLEELATVLRRSKFRRYVTEDEAAQYVDTVRRLAIILEDPEQAPAVSADPKDDYLMALAGSAGATVVSGDPHLTKIVDPDPTVLTPRVFVDRLS